MNSFVIAIMSRYVESRPSTLTWRPYMDIMTQLLAVMKPVMKQLLAARLQRCKRP